MILIEIFNLIEDINWRLHLISHLKSYVAFLAQSLTWITVSIILYRNFLNLLAHHENYDPKRQKND